MASATSGGSPCARARWPPIRPWSSGNSPTIWVTRSALQRRGGRGGRITPPPPGGGGGGGGGGAGGAVGGSAAEDPLGLGTPSPCPLPAGERGSLPGPPPIPSSTSQRASFATRSTLSATVP